MPKPTHFLYLSCFAFLFSACAGPGDEPLPTTPATAGQSEEAAEPQSQPVPEISPEPVPQSVPEHSPDDLLGLEPKAVQDLLGPVSLKRWEDEAQVMQFANGQCVLDIYFYETSHGGAFQASYLSARTPTGADVDAASCLTSLLPE